MSFMMCMTMGHFHGDWTTEYHAMQLRAKAQSNLEIEIGKYELIDTIYECTLFSIFKTNF